MTTEYLYDNNLPFTTPIASACWQIRDRVVNKNMASIIVIDGPPGVGKTTLAYHIASFMQRMEIDAVNQIGMGGKDFIKKLNWCRERGLNVCIYDEAGDFDKRGAVTTFNKMLNNVFDTFRTFKVIVILCLPTIYVLDSRLFDKQVVQLLIHVKEKKLTYCEAGLYSLSRIYYLRKSMDTLTVRPFAYTQTKPNVHAQFKNLPPDKALLLDKISSENKVKLHLGAEIQLEGLITYSEIVSRLGVTERYVSYLLKNNQIKAIRKVGRNTYYHKDILDRLKRLTNQDHGDDYQEQPKRRDPTAPPILS